MSGLLHRNHYQLVKRQLQSIFSQTNSLKPKPNKDAFNVPDWRADLPIVQFTFKNEDGRKIERCTGMMNVRKNPEHYNSTLWPMDFIDEPLEPTAAREGTFHLGENKTYH